MAILTGAEYPAIRSALDTGLSEADLPDSIIAQDIYHWAAEQDVIDRDADAETRTGSDQRHITNAAVFFCAARLAPAVVRITSLSVQTRDVSYSKATFDPEKRAAELREMAEDELAEVLTPDETPMPTIFTVATGRRGR